MIYLGTFNNQLMAYPEGSTSPTWSFATSDWVWSAPIVTPDVIYTADAKGMVYAINRENGTKLWEFEADSAILSTPLLREDVLYFGTELGSAYAITIEGVQKWNLSLGGNLYTSPVDVGENIVFTSMDNATANVTAYSPEGTIVWSFGTDN
jgi:outer membrane protein assembly factor BamB